VRYNLYLKNSYGGDFRYLGMYHTGQFLEPDELFYRGWDVEDGIYYMRKRHL
jgi:hypothetical protein